MGILNVTPDSFSDGGRYPDTDAAVARALEMERQGATFIDVGGESTRPGSNGVPLEEELERVIPVIRAIREQSDVLISIDTRKTEVARQAIEAGADIVNDIEALAAPGMAKLCAETGCGVVIMHMKGQPETMQDHPDYADVVSEVTEFFRYRFAFARDKGIRDEQICWDPGIGFGKDLSHNLTLIAHLGQIRVGERPILLALSRKATLSGVLGNRTDGRSPLATATMTAYGYEAGAQIHRVHDVYECSLALKLIKAVKVYE